MENNLKTRFEDVMNGEVKCRMVSDMSVLEKQFYENLVNEVVYNNQLSLTKHAEIKRTKRHLSMGKIRYVYYEGALSEIQFDSSGIKAVLTYSTRGQSKKKFATNIVLDLVTAQVVSVWNREYQYDVKKKSATYKGKKDYLTHEETNTIRLANKFLKLDYLDEPTKFVNFLRKYNSSLGERQEKKIANFLNGKTSICQL